MSFSLSKKMSISDYINYISIAFISFLSIFPFIYIVSVSFTDPDVYQPFKFYLIPPKFSLESYAFILGTPAFPKAIFNTTFVTVIGTILSLIVTFTYAYAVSRKKLAGRKVFNALVIFFLIFNAGIIPNYILVGTLGLKNSLWSLIVMGLTNSWSIIIVRSFIMAIPEEIHEAAVIDGCNDLSIFFRIIIPLSAPCIATFALFFAVANWNMYFDAMLYLQAADKWTLQVLVKSIVVSVNAFNVSSGADSFTPPIETMRMAAVVIAMAPIVCVYPFLQKYFVTGVMLGAVKG